MGVSESEPELQRLCEEIYQATRTDPKRSLQLARKAIAFARSHGRGEALGLAARSLGHAWRSAAQYRLALAAYAASDRAFELAGQAVERARNAIGKLDALMYLGEYERALAEAAEAERVFLEAGATLRLATLRVNLGSVLYRMDRYREAAEAYEKCLPVFQEQGDRDTVANVQFNLATVYVSLFQFQHAVALFEKAAPYFRAAGMRVLEAMTDYNLACVDHLRGHYSSALGRLDRAIDVLGQDGDQGLLASCQLEQSDLFLSLRMPDRAARAAELAAEQFARLGMRYEHAQALSSRGVSLALSGRPSPALEVLATALRLFREEQNEHWIGLCRLHLAEIHRDAGRSREASALAREARRVLEARGETRGVALSDLLLGTLAADPKHRMHLGRAIRAFRRTGAAGLEAESLARLARQLHVARRSRGALICLQRAIELVERLRTRMSETSLRRHFLSNHADLYARAAVIESARPRKALEWLERGRARALVELLEERDFRGEIADHAGGTTAVLRDELNSLYRRLDSQSWANEHAAELRSLRERIHLLEVEIEAESLRHDIVSTPIARSGASRSENRGLPAVAPISAEGLALEYFEVDGSVGVVAIRPDEVRVFPHIASKSEIRGLLRQLRLGLASELADSAIRRDAGIQPQAGDASSAALSNPELGRLYELLIHPVEREGGIPRELLILPASNVAYVPFAALCGPDAGPLAARTALSVSPSLDAHRQFLALGGEPARIRPALVMGHGPGLPSVEEEVSAVASILGPASIRLTGDAATSAAFQQHAPEASVIHLACHGVFRRDHPLFSSLVLADGRLSFFDLFRTRLDGALVVLSACETGFNDEAPGEELVGLSGGLLQAGARAVVVSLWDVCDASSPSFMARFYAHLRAGRTAAAALAGAQMDVRREWPHPIYWAPYVMLGDPSLRLV